MLKRNMASLSVIALLIGTTGAWAIEGEYGKPDQGQGGAANAKLISFEEMRERCANPEKTDIQRAPQDIKIQCVDVRREWMAAAPGEVPLPSSRMVYTTLVSNKFQVGMSTKVVPMYAKGGTCLRFKEVEKSIGIEKALSCGEILGMKGSLEDYCQASLDSARAANPKLVSIKDVEGSIVDTCGGLGSSGKGGK